jgi:Fur family transcriptional regulator, zinc uptake regulator
LNSLSPQCAAPESRSNAVTEAELVCRARGVQFTPFRKLVLQVVWDAAQPLDVYTILKRIQRQLGRRIAPPTIYRALDFLLEQRFISKLESCHAFVPCANAGRHRACAYFICENCGTSEEINDAGVQSIFESKASELGFHIKRSVMELQGLCASCRGRRGYGNSSTGATRL